MRKFDASIRDLKNECHNTQEDRIKANFYDIYTNQDPREYYRVLYGLDYIIPDLAKPVFRQVATELERQRGRPLKVLDLGCSYGINAALLRLPLDLARLAQRYADLASYGLTSKELAYLDRRYFDGWPKQPMQVVGMDVSAPATAYAKEVGLLDAALAIDLETQELTPEAREVIRDVDLIISTGCIGYVGQRTFARILEAIEGPRPWLASFVLRMYPFEPIADELARHGIASQKLQGVTFVQRRFHSERECSDVLRSLESSDIATAGKEAEGLLHAEFYLSRPEACVDQVPLEQIVQVANGEQHTFGRRYRRDADNVLRLTR